MSIIILTIIALIFINALLSAIEISLVSLSESKLDLEIEKGIKKAVKIKKIKSKPTHFLSVIQIVIHILTVIQGYMLHHDSHGEIQILLTILSLVLGDIIPKRIALIYPLKTAYYLLGLFNLVCFFMKPFVWLLHQISNLILYCLRIDPNKTQDIVSEDELRFLLSASYNQGVINSNENNMIQNIFDFNTTKVSDIMRHRKEIVAIRHDISINELREFILKEKYTRFPVYMENLDKILGIVHIKDLFKVLLVTNDQRPYKNNYSKFNINHYLRRVFYITEFKNISELLKEMQSKQKHMAIVVDEYGGTAGIVTIEDVIEEILGEIQDEYDKNDFEIVKISDQEFIIKGTVHLCDIEEYLNANLPVDDYDTLSGFMLDKLRRMPESNEKIRIMYNDWIFDGLSHNGLVITKVRVTKSNIPKQIK
ncbi:hemolysin family protein [Candidatus Phytoplasma australasiaticum]|uniref:hemolysin family protein n=1 Tax=Candidatus Phytoplasma australasiaticum TaxID=2754999 RepID=UPI002712A738|nr:hemolysin family protein [Candidatus Phytoplasma australasiaticum]MDO8058610.1 hemolysin family protein [Candidatus Phytoplasma australasiaticum]